MTRTEYIQIMRSLRANGTGYTMRFIHNVFLQNEVKSMLKGLRSVDKLQARARMHKLESKSNAFYLTTCAGKYSDFMPLQDSKY